MRVKLLLLCSAACLMPVGLGAAEGDRLAPVVFASDPGAAHPRNVVRELAGLEFGPVPTDIETVVAKPIPDALKATQAVADSGTFDYGGNGIDAVMIAAATNEPRVLTAAYVPQESEAEAAVAPRQEGNALYRQDPIYRVAQANEPEAVAQTVAYQPETAETSTLPSGYITVQPGDTVFALSRRYDVKPAAIIDANQLAAPYALNIGQVLRIPGAEGEAEVIAEAAYEPAPEPKPAEPALQQVAEATAPAETYSPAQPVYRQDVSYADETMGATYHTVEPGNTLYSISRLYGVDVAELAAANNIEAPYGLSVGQNLLIPAMASQSTASVDAQPAIASTAKPATAQSPVYTLEPSKMQEETTEASYSMPKTSEASRFDWPLQGRIIMTYGLSDDGRRNDGINIAAPVGTPIRSVEDGEVVYRGSELEGYGNLLLIKHSDGWVSAYAHTDAILVQKGDKVRQGQIIAKVGTTGSVDQPQLHFELRHELKPTDPIAALDGSDIKALKAGYRTTE